MYKYTLGACSDGSIAILDGIVSSPPCKDGRKWDASKCKCMNFTEEKEATKEKNTTTTTTKSA